MDTTKIIKSNLVSNSRDVKESSWDDEFKELMQTLPKDENWFGVSLYRYEEGFWYSSTLGLKPTISFQRHFQASDTDVIVATFPKCGTTWLKALTFSALNRNQFAKDENPLFTSNPHQLVRFLEFDIYLNDPFPDLDKCSLYKPRLFSTHLPYSSLPTSIKHSDCKIVYIARNPMDMFISHWFFMYKQFGDGSAEQPVSLDEAFDKFCDGIYESGPYFDFVLGYWKASQKNPNKVFFLQYEDLKEDINTHLKSLAVFLGVPFTEEEEKQGVVEEIAEICSFDKLKELEVNKKGFTTYGDKQATNFVVQHKRYFRKGKVGDWKNYLKPSMVERLEKLIQEKLGNSGLTFKFSKTSSDDKAVA